jgi:NAD(P)H-dependent FMN reductase
MPQLQVVTVSTREGRQGPKVAAWFVERARAHAKFDVRPVDLAEVALPLFDEPNHPRFKKYTHEHTKRWSAIVDAADAFVFVTPEYNFFAPPSFVNALDYLVHEWAYKPCAFVSYGGVSGGTRSAQMAKLQATSLKMMPIPEAVAVPFFNKSIDEAGAFDPGDVQAKAAAAMLDELRRWSDALAPMRARTDS